MEIESLRRKNGKTLYKTSQKVMLNDKLVSTIIIRYGMPNFLSLLLHLSSPGYH